MSITLRVVSVLLVVLSACWCQLKAEDLAVWQEDSMTKVFQTAPGGAAASAPVGPRAMVLHAARNEVASAQFVIQPGADACDLKCDALAGCPVP